MHFSILSKIMNRNYSCKNCDEYCTNHISEISKHLLRKKQCMKSIKSYDYSNDQFSSILS